jgi:hypothetical protein
MEQQPNLELRNGQESLRLKLAGFLRRNLDLSSLLRIACRQEKAKDGSSN